MAKTAGGRSAGGAGQVPACFSRAASIRPDGTQIAVRLVAGLTDAVASVLGEQARSGTSVELVVTPEGRTALGGTISG
jgi:hypothetical protein